MSKPRKVIRTKHIYGKKHYTPNKKVLSTLIFALLVVIFVVLGFIVFAQFDKWGKKSNTSSTQSVTSTPQNTTSSDGINSTTSDTSSDDKQEVKAVTSKVLMPDEYIGKDFKAVCEGLKKDNYTAVTLYLKDTEGVIYYDTASPLAKKYNTVNKDTISVKEYIDIAKEQGLELNVMLSSLKDPNASHVRNENSFAYGNELSTNWMDNSPSKGGKSWLNPYMDKTKEYIGELCKELGNLGVKNIYLDYVMFPDQNTSQMNTIKTTPAKDEALQEFVDGVQEKAGENATVIPVSNVTRSLFSKEVSYLQSYDNVKEDTLAVEISMEDITKNQKEYANKLNMVESATKEDIVKEILKRLNGKKLTIICEKQDITTLGIENINYIVK